MVEPTYDANSEELALEICLLLGLLGFHFHLSPFTVTRKSCVQIVSTVLGRDAEVAEVQQERARLRPLRRPDRRSRTGVLYRCFPPFWFFASTMHCTQVACDRCSLSSLLDVGR